MVLTNQCTGCMACYSACPVNAITITQNSEGFYVPKIDSETCIDCGRCNKICPQDSAVSLKNQANEYCYATQAEKEECMNSSSGGMFPLLAKYIFSIGGYVCGAAFSEDFKSVKHIIIDKEDDLYKLRSSKYVQSFIGDTFKQIKTLLEKQKFVLFSGTPCQVAGLKAFLSNDYENLFTVDLLCHGTPSPLVWEKYLAEISQGKKIEKVNFRDKKFGWGTSLSIVFDDKTLIGETLSNNIYLQGFLQDLTLNDTCYYCKYTDTNRVGDITLGDFWGIQNVDRSFENTAQGVSLVIANTQKGEYLFSKIDLQTSKKHLLSNAVNYNPVLKSSVLKHPNRKTFFENLYAKPVIENLKKSLEQKYDGIIANLWWSENNYGAVLSAYAIQQFLLSKGYDYNLLNFIPYNTLSEFSFNFVQKYLKLTHRIYNLRELKELNNCTNNFVVGTDQVFRYVYTKDLLPLYTLSYTNPDKRRIAFSASFGKNEFDETNFLGKYVYQKCLQRFDAVSVRENSGIKLCKENFGLKVEDILDPVFLLDKSYWDSLADSVNIDSEEYLVSYILDESDETLKLYNFLEQKYGLKIKKLSNTGISPEKFLSEIKNARLFITDSFHGACFAMIFNKKFLCMINQERGNSRFDNLKLKFNIDSVFYNGVEAIKKSQNLFESFDYENFANIVESERAKAQIWLVEAFNSKKKNKKLPKHITICMQILIAIQQKRFRNLLKKKRRKYKCNRKFKKTLSKYKNKKIVFLGASIFLEEFLKKHKIKNKNILGIVDKNPAMYGKQFGKYTIDSPEKLSELNPDVIICSIKNNHERVYPKIKESLEQNYPNIELVEDIFEK